MRSRFYLGFVLFFLRVDPRLGLAEEPGGAGPDHTEQDTLLDGGHTAAGGRRHGAALAARVADISRLTAKAAGEKGDAAAAALDALVKLVEHGDLVVRLKAVEALGAYAGNSKVKDALERASRKDENRNVRSTAAAALARAAQASKGEAPPDRVPFSLRHSEPATLKAQSLELFLNTWERRDVDCLAFSADGKVLGGANDKDVILWDLPSRRMRRILTGHQYHVCGIAFSMDGRFLATASRDRTVRLWDARTRSPMLTLGRHDYHDCDEDVRSVAFSPDSRFLAIGADSAIDVWDIDAAKVLKSLSCSRGTTYGVAFSPDGSHLAGVDGTVLKTWDTPNWALKWSQVDKRERFAHMTFGRDGSVLAVTCSERAFRLWQNGKVRATLSSGDAPWAVVSSDGMTVGTFGGEETKIALWDANSGRLAGRLEADGDAIKTIAFSPDGTMLASGARNGAVSLWDMPTRVKRSLMGLRPVEKAGDGVVNLAAFSPDGRTVAIVCGQTLRFWDVCTGALIRTVQAHPTGVFSVAFCPDGRVLASSGFDHTVKLWSSDGQSLGTLLTEKESIRRTAFSPDGKHLLTAGDDRAVRAWDVQTGNALRTLTAFGDRVICMATPGDGSLVTSGANDGTVRVVRVETGDLIREFQVRCVAHSLALSPDGRSLASVFGRRGVKIWDVATGDEKWRFPPQIQATTSLAYSPDGTVLATGTIGGILTLWKADTGEPVGNVAHEGVHIRTAAFSPNGRVLAVGAGDRLCLWDVATRKRLVTMVVLPPRQGEEISSDWVAYTPDGWFRGTARVSEFALWQTPEEIVPFDVYGEQRNRPDLVEQALSAYKP